MNKKIYIILSITVVVLVVVFVSVKSMFINTQLNTEGVAKNTDELSAISGKEAIVYKSPNCGCCVGYVKELKNKGVNIKVIKTDDMDSIKQQYNIPSNMQSCHTIAMGGYFIEGHVPIEAVEKLFEKKPNIDGIALPGMPSGTPGMPGSKRAPFKVYQLTNGEPTEFMVL